jgi:hypothetical protein
MQGVKKLVTDAVRGESAGAGPTIAERARALRAGGRADEAATLVRRSPPACAETKRNDSWTRWTDLH